MTEETAQVGEPAGEPVVIEVANDNPVPEVPANDADPKDDQSEAEKTKSPWYMKEITNLRSSKRDIAAEKDNILRQNAALLEEVAALKSNKTDSRADENLLPQSEIDRLADIKASQIADTRAFNARCNSVYNEGKEEFPDFEHAIANLQAVGALGENANKVFLDTVTELPNSHKLLHHLGSNPEEASRITALPPVKMAIELAKIESAFNKPVVRQTSKAPAPIKPVSGTAKNEFDPAAEKVNMNEWNNWFQKKLADKNK